MLAVTYTGIFKDASFDLVVAAYSLYFFVDVIPDVARVLRPGGIFLAVTHSEESFTGLLEAVGLAHEECPLLRSLRRFSSESGGGLLARVFADVEHIPYLNTLTFEEDDLGDLLAYLSFKLPLVRAGVRYGAELPRSFVEAAAAGPGPLRRTPTTRGDCVSFVRSDSEVVTTRQHFGRT